MIVIVGIIGLTMLPIDQYPQITPPVVKISASYPGASATTVSQAVATPIEQELNGTPGMLYMESTSSNSGGFSATVTFDISADPDLSAVEIQNRLKLAESRLPAEVIQNGISVEKQAASQLMTICLTSTDPKFDEIYLSNFATINVLDLLRRIPGVGRVSNIGSRYYAMQIWVQPDKMANFGLTVQDLQNALKDQNRESAAGVLGQQPVTGVDVTIPITTQGRLSTVSQFEDIVVRANPDGSIIRLRDVARVSLEASSYNTESGINGGNAAVLGVYMLPGANAMEVAENVKKAMEDISRNFPEGLTYEIPFDMTTYISESIHEVYKTLFEALFLVIVVVFLSLQSWRATLIPVVAVPISLIGTFGFMLIFGFSLNILTLLGLILAIGIVVDDAIVVVENVERIMEEERLGAYEATKKAMDGLTGALIATSLVLAAVFVPVSFLPGITGQLYRQFTVTIVVSVLISTIVALTLSPVMCSLILKPGSGKKKNIVFRYINYWLRKGNTKYIAVITRLIAHPRRVMSVFGMVLIAILLLHRFIPTSFLPTEDQGYFKVELELPEGATLERTLAHPTWNMGRKVTIDSATLMNKGLELIEARNLFGINEVDIKIHRQSVVHGAAAFKDGSLKIYASKPDMRIPIAYALSMPKRYKLPFSEEIGLEAVNGFTYTEPDTDRFPCLKLAKVAADYGTDRAGAVLTAADEAAVNAYLRDEIDFYGVSELIEKALERFATGPEIADVYQLHSITDEVKEYILESIGGGN